MTMQREFPGHRIWREIIPGRTVYIARSQHPAARPHTVVTPDLGELQAALTEASRAADHDDRAPATRPADALGEDPARPPRHPALKPPVRCFA